MLYTTTSSNLILLYFKHLIFYYIISYFAQSSVRYQVFMTFISHFLTAELFSIIISMTPPREWRSHAAGKCKAQERPTLCMSAFYSLLHHAYREKHGFHDQCMCAFDLKNQTHLRRTRDSSRVAHWVHSDRKFIEGNHREQKFCTQ